MCQQDQALEGSYIILLCCPKKEASPLPPLDRTALESPTLATKSFCPTNTAVTAVHPSSLFPPAGFCRYFLSVSMKDSTAGRQTLLDSVISEGTIKCIMLGRLLGQCKLAAPDSTPAIAGGACLMRSSCLSRTLGLPRGFQRAST